MVAEIFHAIVPILAILVFIPFNAMLMVLMERRALALFTVRRGPCRVGPDGALQTAADAIKLLLKEDITPTGADALMFTAAPVIFFAPSIFAAVPLLAAATNNNAFFQVVNLPTGIFYVLAAASVPVVGIVMGGWASNNKYSLVGGLRSAAQAISYEIPLVLSLISICVLNRTLDVVKICQLQAG
jgi:NADH-quinone oxidoreductase subunit H